jgi:hypothetical protein
MQWVWSEFVNLFPNNSVMNIHKDTIALFLIIIIIIIMMTTTISTTTNPWF